MGWSVDIPRQQIKLNVEPVLKDQELLTKRSTGVTYWEGAATVSGMSGGKAVKGQSYVEMTGYAEAFKKKI
jgi:predicted secreted hydrolase